VSKKARTPIVEYDNVLAIELGGEGRPQERDRLTDQALVVAYDRRPGRRPRWRLRSLLFDREEWTRSAIRRWWAAHSRHLPRLPGPLARPAHHRALPPQHTPHSGSEANR